MEVSLIYYDSANILHAKSFAELNREWLTKYFRVEAHDEKIFADPKRAIIDKGGIILFAKIGDNIIGTGCLSPLPDGYFEIAKMAVTEVYKGFGIGEKIFVALINEARARKLPKIFIITNTTLKPAMGLYLKHGFTESGENRHGHYERGDITHELDINF